MMCAEIFVLLAALCVSCGSAQLHYTPSGSCEVSRKYLTWSETVRMQQLSYLPWNIQSEHTCEYVYSAMHSQFTNAEDPITVTASVQVTCESSELPAYPVALPFRFLLDVFCFTYKVVRTVRPWQLVTVWLLKMLTETFSDLDRGRVTTELG